MRDFQLQPIESADRAALIDSARHRLLIYAPGLGPAEIAALERVVAYLPDGQVHLYLDVSPASFKAGYWHGQPAQALDTLMNSPANIINIKGGRLGLLIVDGLGMSFTPPLPRLEAEPPDSEANAILYSPEMTELLWNSLIIHPYPAEELITGIQEDAGPDSYTVRKRSLVTPGDIARVVEMQSQAPAADPVGERQLERLRATIKLVHFSVQGHQLQNRTIAMPAEVTEMLRSTGQEINQRLHTSWRLFAGAAEEDQEIRKLESQRKKIELQVRKYLKPLSHYGSGLLIKDIQPFLDQISALELVLDAMRSAFERKLPEFIAQSRQKLISLVVERARNNEIQLPDLALGLFEANLGEQERRRLAAEQMVDRIAWPAPSTMIKGIKCQYSIDDVTLNHLQQESFREAFKRAYRYDADSMLKTKEQKPE